MKAITNSNIDPMGIGTWAVITNWWGEDRTVFTGSIWECARFVIHHTTKGGNF